MTGFLLRVLCVVGVLLVTNYAEVDTNVLPQEEIATEIIVVEPEQEVVTRTLYEDFLEGNEKLYFDYSTINFPEATVVEGMTLSELLESFPEQYWGLEGTPEVEYAYLDCGNDGETELAVRFVGMGIYSPGDDSSLVYIIKEIDERLELCYCYETWARSDTSINRYGYVTSGGSGGASNSGYGAGYIDAMGRWNYLYNTETEYDINQLSWSDDLKELPVVAMNKSYEGEIVVCTTTFEDMSSPEAYYNTERFYTYYAFGEAGDIYAEGVVKEIFDEAGVKYYRPEEIDDMISQKEAALGITEEIRMASGLTWEKLSQ